MSAATPAAACAPYDSSGVVCDTSVPRHWLSDGDPDDSYRGFIFSTDDYPYDKAVFDSNWKHHDIMWTSDKLTTQWAVPTRTGATVTLPEIGVWTTSQGIEHMLDATLTVLSTNGGAALSYRGLFGLAATAPTYLNADGVDTGAIVNQEGPAPIDETKRTGIQVRVSFTYHDTGEPVPDTFEGLTGFADLDGAYSNEPSGNLNYVEGMEVLDGFDGIWLPDDPHLVRYGDNGYGGTDDCYEQTDLSSEHARRHMFTAAFSGPEFTVRYSQGRYRAAWGTLFSTPLLSQYPLVYDLNGGAGVIPNKQ